MMRSQIALLLFLFSTLVPVRADEPTQKSDAPLTAKVTPTKSPLADAAESSDWMTVARLLVEGSNVDAAQVDGMTALHWAVHRNDETTVGRLVNAKCNVNATTRYQVTPLSIACTLGKPVLVELLLKAGADANSKQPGRETPLMIAARTGNADSVRRLLEHRADHAARERKGQTALMWAAAEGNVEVVDELIKAGADLNASVDSGFTAMMFAAREGRSEVVKRLLKAGVDVNAEMKPSREGDRVPREGTSALIMAVESGHFELALELVAAGANPNDQRNGYTALHVLTWVRKPNRGEDSSGDPPPRGSGKLTDLQLVRELVKAGADVNTKLEKGEGGRAILNPRGATPFLFAARTADVPLMTLLIELGANPKLNNADGCTPLMAAAGVGVRAVGEEAGTEPEVIAALDFLVKQGLDVNAVDANKETAMHGAAYRNFPLVVTRLAELGADSATWDHKNKPGWTPVMIAQGKRPGSFKPSPETVAALRAAMSKTRD